MRIYFVTAVYTDAVCILRSVKEAECWQKKDLESKNEKVHKNFTKIISTQA